ncbi:MAG: hypothetical protein V1794_00380 [Candidatus Glassbacteria bacterium]
MRPFRVLLLVILCLPEVTGRPLGAQPGPGQVDAPLLGDLVITAGWTSSTC